MTSGNQFEDASQFMVGLAEFAVSREPQTILGTYQLGACLALAIYDPTLKAGGVLHSLLPTSSIDPARAAARPGMFLDTGLAAVLTGLENFGAKRENLRVVVAGGAQIMDETSPFNIGKLNYDVLAELLAQNHLKIHAEDVGGRNNRSLQLSVATGEVRLRYSGQTTSKVLCKP